MAEEKTIIKIMQGSALEKLRELPSESVSCVVTSPPYWGLRAYGTEPQIWDGEPNCGHEWEIKRQNIAQGSENPNPEKRCIGSHNPDSKYSTKNISIESGFCTKCRAWRGELGLEPDFNLYIKHLCDIFDEVKRVLRKDGTCWVVLGYSYNSLFAKSKNVGGIEGKRIKEDNNFSDAVIIGKKGVPLPDKSLCMIPYRFAVEMVNRGWVLRNIIIWHKRNCMPSSVRDRFTVDYEPIFFFSKSRKYWFEQQFEPLKTSVHERHAVFGKSEGKEIGQAYGRVCGSHEIGRNMRCVWTINPEPFSEAHFACYPEKLVEPMIKAGCPKEICTECGKAREIIYEEKKGMKYTEEGKPEGMYRSKMKWNDAHPTKNPRWHSNPNVVDYTKCSCNAPFIPGTVLDPFMGSGTTGLVAKKLGRNFIGIELNPTYIRLAEERIAGFERSDWKAKKEHKLLHDVVVT